MDYAVGASMLVTREFLSTVGLMSEEYFLYYEELDWALRAKHGFVIGYARESLVYHKAGASIGSSNTTSRRSLMSDYYLMRNRLVITRKFFPQYLLSVRLFMLVEVLIRVLNGNLKQASNTLRLAFNRDCADPASTRK